MITCPYCQAQFTEEDEKHFQSHFARKNAQKGKGKPKKRPKTDLSTVNPVKRRKIKLRRRYGKDSTWLKIYSLKKYQDLGKFLDGLTEDTHPKPAKIREFLRTAFQGKKFVVYEIDGEHLRSWK